MLLCKTMLKYFLVIAAIVSPYGSSIAKPSPAAPSDWLSKGRETGLPIPRFVSVKANRARMRIGPAFEYAVEWVYQVQGLPLEITIWELATGSRLRWRIRMDASVTALESTHGNCQSLAQRPIKLKGTGTNGQCDQS